MNSKYVQITVFCLSLALVGCSNKAVDQNSDQALSLTLLELAESAESNFNYSGAAGHYNQLYKREPNNIDAVLGTARNLRYAGVPADAVKELKLSILKHGKNPRLSLELSKSQLTASRINDARETINDVSDKGELKWQFKAVEALILDRLGRYREAQKLYLEVLEHSKNNISESNNLALSYSLSGDLDKGIKILEGLVSKNRFTIQTRQNLVMLLVLNGDYEKAESFAKKDYTPKQVVQNLAAYKLLSQHRQTSAVSKPKPENKIPSLVTQKVDLAKTVKPYIAQVNSTVREGPARHFKWITFLKQGEKLEVMGTSKDGKWFLIALPNGKKGFVHHSLVKPQS